MNISDDVQKVIGVFAPAPVDVECVDHWPPCTLSKVCMEVYRMLEAEDALCIQKVVIDRHTGAAKVYYLAQTPHEWILEQLRDKKRRMEKEC